MSDPRLQRKQKYAFLPLTNKILDPVSKELSNSIVKLEPDVAEAFPDAASVNEALRCLIQVTKENKTAPPHIDDGT